MAQRVIVYGGKGALGSTVVNLLKSKNYVGLKIESHRIQIWAYLNLSTKPIINLDDLHVDFLYRV